MLILYILGQIFLLLLLILLILLQILLLILLAVLLIPFRYYFTGEKLDDSWFRLQVSWLFGGVKLHINYQAESISSTIQIFGVHRNITGEPGKEKKSKHKDNQDKGNKSGNKPPYSYFTREILEKAVHCLLKLLNHCMPAKFELYSKVGFEDPMYTGFLCALQGAGYAILDKFNIHLQTSFEEEELKGSLTIAGRIQLFYLLLVAIEFLVTRPFRTIFIKNQKIKIKRRLKRWHNLILKKT